MRTRSTRYYSKRQEDAIAKSVGGKRTPNSGATPTVKGDVVARNFLIEAKTHVRPTDSFTIKREWIEKNREESFQMGRRHSALAIDFGDGEQHYLISDRDFIEYVNYVDGQE